MQNRPENQTAYMPDGALRSAALRKAISRAQWAILWEHMWPSVVAVATLFGLFLSVSWLGLWLWLPPVPRVVVLALFGVATTLALIPVLRLRFPSRADALQRVDQTTGVPHRPATAMSDRIATS